MESLKGIQTGLAVLVAVVAMGSAAGAQESKRKPMDANDPYRKVVAQVLKINKDVNGKVSYEHAGDAFFIGNDGCNRTLVTNFHVAYRQGLDPKSGEVLVMEQTPIGHEVMIWYDFDIKTGKARKSQKAKVVRMGDFDEETAYGLSQDIAVLQAENCAGNEYGIVKHKLQGDQTSIPKGELVTVSTRLRADGSSEIVSEVGCRSTIATPISGVLFTNCESAPGMSGSPLFEREGDNLTFVSMATLKTPSSMNIQFAVSVQAKNIAKLVQPILGTAAITVASSGERKPQAADGDVAVAVSAQPRVVVR